MENSLGTPETIENNLILSLDFGGTKLAAAVVDLNSEKIVSPVIRRETPVAKGASGTLKAMIECGMQALSTFDQSDHVSSVGISFGGPVSADRRSVLRSNHVADWNGAPLVEAISRAFKLPAVMDNDGNVAALGAWWFGGYRNLANLVYIQASTGVGGGFILGHSLYRGAGLAGEVGHCVVDINGPLCSCGRRGCLESFCSGWAIARDGRIAWSKDTERRSPLAKISNNQPDAISAAMVFAACRMGDPACEAIVQIALRHLAIVTVNLITCTDPQAVVVGGGLTRSRDLFERYYLPVVHEQMHPFFQGRCQVDISKFSGDELLLGAALLAKQEINQPVKYD